VQKTVACCIEHGWEIRVRSGGHSYEGLSSTSDIPFVIIDLMNLDAINIDMASKTAWVEAGATVGQLYDAIADRTAIYGFPAGVCTTMGTGGHFSGGGLSLLSRKHGIAADNIIDALFVDASGNLLNRQKMGEDVFWALRGGGGGSWGVVVAWRIKLVSVPSVVTVFNVYRTGREAVTKLVNQWQSIAPAVEEDLFIRVVISGTQLNGGQRDVKLTFNGMYLGPLHQLLETVNKSFPEMGMVSGDCKETSWIDSISYTAYTNRTELRNRYNSNKNYFKAKSDVVKTPIPPSALEGAWKFLEEELSSYVIFYPMGGIMDQIPSSEIAFPHRAGNLYLIQYQVTWNDPSKDAEYIARIRGLYEYMTPYVSNSPRASYVNYLDLDLGVAPNGTATVEEARSWGEKYFVHNYDRLVKIKSTIDPYNVFRNSQSIPVNK
jgi:FAD/FMN-containing dehydrogenase